MRADAVRADRAYEVRSAARSWRRAGMIDEATLTAIEAAHADDRVRARPGFRILFFFFTAFGVLASFGLAIASGVDSEGSIGLLALGFGIPLAVLTELQIGRLRRDRGGTEEATAFLAVVFLAGAAAWFVFDVLEMGVRSELTLFLCLAAVLLAVASWRWGRALEAAGAALLVLWVLSRLPHGRALWAAAGIISSVFLIRASGSARLAPSHRRGCAWALLVAIGGLYAAVSIYSFDHHLIEALGGRANPFHAIGVVDPVYGTIPVAPGLSWTAARIICALLTAALPAALIVIGIITRRRLLLDAGGILAALSLATVRAYAYLAPPWAVLVAAGGGLFALALVLRRWLDAAPGKDRAGFTPEPLFEGSAHHRTLEIALTSLSPPARALTMEPGFRGKGGASGGAGAGGEF